MEDNMYIPDCIPERHLKNLDGDCIRIYLYRLMFGEKIQSAAIAAALNLEVEIVEHCIEKLILLGLWNTRIQEYQEYLQNIDLKTILEDDTALISNNTKIWLCSKCADDLTRMIDIEIIKYENLFLAIEKDTPTLLPIEIIFLIMYCIEFLLLPEALIKYLIINYENVSDINILEYKAEWCANFGITDVGMLKKFEDNYHIYSSVIKDVFSLNRSLYISEIKYVIDWLLYDEYPLDLVIYACLITKDRLQQIAIPYTNKILFNWNKNGISTLDDIVQNTSFRNLSRLKLHSLQNQARTIVKKHEKNSQKGT